jgi:hypothetical protein
MTTQLGPKRFHPASHASALVLLASAACNALYPVGEAQCSVDADCAARGSAFAGTVCVDEVCKAKETADAAAAGPWDCLGQVAWPSSGPATHTLRVRVVDVLTGAPPKGATVRVCSKLDVPCASPLASTASVDDTGLVTAGVAAGFDGYLEISGTDVTPALFFVTRPVYADVETPGVVPMVSPAGFENIAKAIGTTIDPASGHIYALASTCLDAPASGVRLELDKKSAATAGYYMVNNAPVGTATSTDAAGSGGFLNVPEGFAKVSGFVAASGARIGESSVVIRKGTVSYPRLLPSP